MIKHMFHAIIVGFLAYILLRLNGLATDMEYFRQRYQPVTKIELERMLQEIFSPPPPEEVHD